MNPALYLPVCVPALFFLCADCANGATLALEGIIEYGIVAGDRRMINTYTELVFDQPGNITYTATHVAGEDYRVFLFEGVQGNITGAPQILGLFLELSMQRPTATASAAVPAGHYLLTIYGEPSEWDWQDDGYVPFFFYETLDTAAPPVYRVNVSGDFRPISTWEGQLDGTFRVTPLPEPGVAMLEFACGSALLLRRRRPRLVVV